MKLSRYSKTGTIIAKAGLLLSCFLLTILVSAQSNGFVIMGNVSGLAKDAVIKITTTQESPSNIATATATDGKFMLKGSLEEPGLYMITLGDAQPQYIFLDNSNIAIEGNKEDLKNLVIKGSKSHDDFVDFRKIFDPLVGEMSAAGAKLNRASTDGERMTYRQQYDSIAALVQQQIDVFVTNKPASYVSPFLLTITMQLNDDVLLLENRYNKLAASIKSSNIGKGLQQMITDGKTGAVGTYAVDFTQPDINGKPVSLSSFKGKYVLVDFWASWCRPCRDENPNVVANYNKFKNKNFTVLGVSLDRPGQKDKWLQAIEQDKLTWTHVSDLKFWQNEAAQLYKVSGIPFNILVDPTGKVIARNLRGPQLQEKLCEVLGGCM